MTRTTNNQRFSTINIRPFEVNLGKSFIRIVSDLVEEVEKNLDKILNQNESEDNRNNKLW